MQPARQDAPSATAVLEPPADAARKGVLGAVLQAGGAIAENQLAHALTTKGDVRLGEHLVRTGVVAEDVVAWAVAHQHGLPYIDLAKETPGPDAAALITADASHAFQILPVRLHPNRTLDVVVADPTDALVRRVLESLPVPRVRIGMAPPSQLRAAIDRTFPGGSTPAAVDGDQRVRRVLEQILRRATTDRASDVHFEVGADRSRVRLRIDGVLRDALVMTNAVARPLLAHLELIAALEPLAAGGPRRGRFRYGIDGRDVDVRVAITPTIGGVHCVLRLRDRSRDRLALSDLGMTPGVAALYAELAQTTAGMLLVSGPARSGTTTTLYATLDAFDHTDRNVMAVEHAMDLVVPGINQLRIDRASGLGFAAAVETIVEQDPDVVLLGDLPDLDSAQQAVRTALSGRLVVAAVPAIDAVDALWRLFDLGVDPRAVTSSVLAVENQRLLRRVCAGCATLYTPAPRELAFFTRRGGVADTFVHGAGCDACGFTGYHGSIGVFEVMPLTNEITRELLAGAPPSRIREVAVSDGMHTLLQHALKLVADRVTTIDEVRRAL
jgi:type IV pilus assembly protein PilB